MKPILAAECFSCQPFPPFAKILAGRMKGARSDGKVSGSGSCDTGGRR